MVLPPSGFTLMMCHFIKFYSDPVGGLIEIFFFLYNGKGLVSTSPKLF